MPGDQGGKGQKVLQLDPGVLIHFITTNLKSLLFHRVSGVYLDAVGVQAWLEKRLDFNNLYMHDEEAMTVTLSFLKQGIMGLPGKPGTPGLNGPMGQKVK